MSAFGLLIIIIGIWIILNADKLGWVMLGQISLNTKKPEQPNPSPPITR
jgi:hypothetical protein